MVQDLASGSQAADKFRKLANVYFPFQAGLSIGDTKAIRKQRYKRDRIDEEDDEDDIDEILERGKKYTHVNKGFRMALKTIRNLSDQQTCQE